ncbi:hypothetical protein [Paenibacillus sp. YN15]|uniref:hypothetical protein n=1 Tax=Paenibacillus sp. YN15 TaxID=1742774 RepID=UPI000DCD0C26|nr:hypothetical protein [Paenibacillus sp. YN15]RAU97636.1 hypothetical protein DQG13_18635 [Paenibacillus sp. YN15]
MDSNERSQICPWCQTEIVWDPEFGPEDTCPHCLNELSGYRSLKLKINQEDGELSLEEPDRHGDDHSGHSHHHHHHDEDDDDDLEVDDLLDDYTVDPLPDDYAERVIAVMDQQEYAPECPNCHELMLHAGVRVISGSAFKPAVPAPLGMPFLPDPYAVDVFVCPSCFKTDEYLTKQTKEDMMQVFVPGTKE